MYFKNTRVTIVFIAFGLALISNISGLSSAFQLTQYAAATSSVDKNNQSGTQDNSPERTSDTATLAIPPNGECPEGTTQASPPLNPQLGCIPNTETSQPNRE